MFVACPHCGYLVALVVAQDGPTRTCPRCNGALQSEGTDGSVAAAVEAPSRVADPTIEAKHHDSHHEKHDSGPDHKREAGNEPDREPSPSASIAATTRLMASIAPAIDDIASTLRKRPSATPTAVLAGDAASVANAGAHPFPASAIEPAQVVPATDAGDTRADDQASRLETGAAAAASDARADDTATPSIAPPAPDDALLSPLSAAVPVTRKRAAARAGKSETAVSSARRAPSFARQHARANASTPRLHWSGPLLIALLAIALVVQLLLAQRAELAADARWRPLLGGLCGVLSCKIPAWREPAALTMLDRNVLPVADRAGVLRVNAGFRNDARWAQPWPTLLLSLEDVDGRRVGQRAFAPKDYRKGHKPGELIAPGQSAAVQFDVLEPAPHVVAFTFDFR